jgi:hypothetical protein
MWEAIACMPSSTPIASKFHTHSRPRLLASRAARFPRLVPGLDFKSSVDRVTTIWAGSIPVPRRHALPRRALIKISNDEQALRVHPKRRGLISGSGTIPALSRGCRDPPLRSRRPFAPTPTVIRERVRSLGATRRKASSNETSDLAGFSDTSVITATGTSVHRPSLSTTGSAEATFLSPLSTAWFPAQDFVRSLENRASLTAQSDT